MAGYIVSKGETIVGTNLNNDSMYIQKGGTAKETTAESGFIHVSNGGKAIVTTLNSYADMHVFSGGAVNSTTVNDWSRLEISKGGVASNTTLGENGSMTVFSGAKAIGTIFDSYGHMYVRGGTVSSATFSNNGSFTLDGGTINGLTLNNGYGDVSSGGTINDLTFRDASLSLYDGTINRADFDDSDLYIYGGKITSATFSDSYVAFGSNATANKITLVSGAMMNVYGYDAKISGVEIKNGGSMSIESGAVLNNVTLAGGSANPQIDEFTGRLAADGGTIKGLTIGSGTSVGLWGCSATKISWTPGDGVVEIRSAAVSFTSKYSGIYIGSDAKHVSKTQKFASETFTSGKSAYIAKGGSAEAIEVNAGRLEIWNGGSATNTTLQNYGILNVSSGGMANGAKVREDGYLNLFGGSASNVIISSGGTMTIAGGSAGDIKILAGGALVFESGAATNVDWTPFNGGALSVHGDCRITFASALTGIYAGSDGMLVSSTGGPIQNWTINNDLPEMYVMSDAVMKNTMIDNGTVYVFGGSATGTILTDNSWGGTMVLYNGAKAVDTTIAAGGLYVYNDATAEKTMVSSGGTFTVGAGGSANSATACSGFYRYGGGIYVSSGAVVSNLVLEYGATLLVEKGAKVTNVSSSYGSIIAAENGASVKKITAVAAESPDSDHDVKNGWADKKKKTINEYVMNSSPFEVVDIYDEIQLDEESASYYNNYVGYTDEIDFRKIHLDNAANLAFDVYATDASKFTVWRWDDSKNKLVSLQATALKLSNSSSYIKKPSIYRDYYVETKTLLLDSGDYFISMESTNAAKGGNAYYSVYISEDSTIFSKGNNEDDDWTALPDAYDLGELSESDSGNSILFDWVGFTDDIDYRKFTVAYDMKANFEIHVYDAAKFTVYQLVSKTDKKGKTTNSLKQLKSVSLKKSDSEAGVCSISTAECNFEAGVDYYLCMESTNAAKGGDTDYNVLFHALPGSEIPMDALAMPDARNIASPDADVLADASAFDNLAAVGDATAWQTVAKLA